MDSSSFSENSFKENSLYRVNHKNDGSYISALKAQQHFNQGENNKSHDHERSYGRTDGRHTKTNSHQGNETENLTNHRTQVFNDPAPFTAEKIAGAQNKGLGSNSHHIRLQNHTVQTEQCQQEITCENQTRNSKAQSEDDILKDGLYITKMFSF